MKKLTVITTTILTTLLISGCGNGTDKEESKAKSGMSKKEVTIKDIVEDEKPHIISQTSQIEDYDGEVESSESHVYLTKNGKIKGIELTDEDITSEFINKLKPENAEKMLDNKDLIERETEWEEPMYVAIDNEEKTPEVTYVVPKSKEVKKDDVSSFEDYMTYGTEDEAVMGVGYTSVTSAQSQDPSKETTYHGTFTYDGSEMNDSEVYMSYGVDLGKKEKKLKSLSVSDIKDMKNGYVYKFEDFD